METAMTKANSESVGMDVRDRAKVVESLVVRGDVSALGPVERARYYLRVCETLGLNPELQPLAFLRLNGKEILYATRGCTDQLAHNHKLTREISDGPKVVDVGGTKIVSATCRCTSPDGRAEVATGMVPLPGNNAEAICNAFMKAETKAKRRATLAMTGTLTLDESEIDTIPAAQPGMTVDLAAATSTETAAPTGENAAATAAADVPAESSGEHAELLAAVHEQIANLELPGPAVKLWIAARPDLAKCTVTERETVWKALCAQTEKVGKMKNAKVWLKKAIAEEDARDSSNHPPDDGGGSGGGGAPRTSAPSTGGAAATSAASSSPAPSANAQAMLAQFKDHVHGKARDARNVTREYSEIANSLLKRRALFENACIWRRALDCTRNELRARGCEEPDALLHGVSQQVYGRAV